MPMGSRPRRSCAAAGALLAFSICATLGAQAPQVSAGRADLEKIGTAFEVPDEIGVYANIGERLVPLKVEVIMWRTGGVLKQMATMNINKGHVNGFVSAPMSPIRADSHPEFIIRTADGVAPEEYQLVRLWKKSNRREFRIWTGGVVHRSSGPAENGVGVDVARIAPRTYHVRPSMPLATGEYGFLAPGAVLSASAASSGKMYTFRVDQKR
jgi:hypothetical protein